MRPQSPVTILLLVDKKQPLHLGSPPEIHDSVRTIEVEGEQCGCARYADIAGSTPKRTVKCPR
jgi:hypothetical protein